MALLERHHARVKPYPACHILLDMHMHMHMCMCMHMHMYMCMCMHMLHVHAHVHDMCIIMLGYVW